MPLPCPFVVKNGSKSRATDASMPEPSSLTQQDVRAGLQGHVNAGVVPVPDRHSRSQWLRSRRRSAWRRGR